MCVCVYVAGKRSLNKLLVGGADSRRQETGGVAGMESDGTEDYWSEEEELLKIDQQ